jgi:DNA modification methylase
MSTATYLVGDVFARMAELPDGSVDLVMTSPPFLAVRSYLPADHPDKHLEIGSEATPAAFLDTLLALTAELGRVLAPHGSICVELGDTYAGSGGAGGDYGPSGIRDGQEPFKGSAYRHVESLSRKATRVQREDFARPDRTVRSFPPGGFKQGGGAGWPLDKSLTGIPTLYAWSLAYGRNLLTGQPSPAGQWRVRNLVAWVRPNPPVGALGDKFRPATSYLTIACKARDRYFDLDAVRTPSSFDRPNLRGKGARAADAVVPGQRHNGSDHTTNPAGAPPLDWWNIAPSGYPGAHYAVYPPELCVRPILAMTPRRVCTTCGKPSRRLTQANYEPMTAGGRPRTKPTDSRQDPESRHQEPRAQAGNGTFAGAQGMAHGRAVKTTETVGWSDCGHGTWRPGHVLDPFAGTGTTLAVATGHGFEATGIDLDPRNAQLAQARLGMFLTIHDGTREATA